jgi:hypothetical protein
LPVRTVVEEFCDVCFHEEHEEVPATDHLRFSWQGRDYVLLVCEDHLGEVRDELQRLADMASPTSGRRATPRQARAAASTRQGGKTLFSRLSNEEKARFRKWANLPKARRISDARVQAWTAAGRP